MFGIFLLLAVLFSRIPIGMMRVRGHKKGLMAFRTHGNIENSPHIVGPVSYTHLTLPTIYSV